MGVDHDDQRVLFHIRSSKFFIYAVVNLAVFTDAYLYGLIIPVLPFALVERVNLHKSEVQKWIGVLLAAYGAGLLIGAPIAGWYADRTSSRKRPYLLGLIALAVSTLAFSLGRSTVVLVIGRLIQGASSAAVHTVGIAILADTVGQTGIGSAMGFVGMSIALGAVLGPMIGGILYNQIGYLAVFGSAYALIILDFLFRVLMIMPKGRTAKESLLRPDARNYGTMSSDSDNAEAPLAEPAQDGISRSASSSSLWSSSATPSTNSTQSVDFSVAPKSLASASLAPVPPVLIQKTSKTPRNAILILLSTPRFLAAILGDFMESVILTGLESILPLRIKTMFSYNSSQVALVFLALSLASFAGPVTGHLSDKVGAKIMVCLGFLFAAPLTILLRLVDDDGKEMVALLCVLLFLIGLSLNMILTSVFAEATYVVDDKQKSDPSVFGAKGAYAQAFGLMNVAYASGSLVGPLVGGLLVERVGWNDLTLATGIVCAMCVLPSIYATGGRRNQASVVANGEHHG